jgi:hypothetical protein
LNVFVQMTFKFTEYACRRGCRSGLGLPTQRPYCVGIVFAFGSREERIDLLMTKTLEFISDVIRNPKHPFRQADDRPDKPQKHRYERRKIKEYIRLADWMAEKTA